MMDFNSSSSLSGQVTALVDAGMQRVRAQQPARDLSLIHISEPTRRRH